MKPSSILYVNPCYYPAHRYGGPVKSVHEMARKLVELGVSVTVFTTVADGPDDLPVPVGTEVDVEGVKVWYFPVERPRSYFRSPALARALRERVGEFDLVHLNWLYVHPTLAAARECLRQGVPYLLSPRGMLDPNAVALHGSLKKRIYLNLLEKRHLTGAVAVHFTADGERDQALTWGWPLRPAVVPNGLNLAEYDRAGNPRLLIERFPELGDKKTVLFLGRMNYIKGLDLLARAWPLVVRAVPDAHLVLAGPDDDGYAEKVRGWLREGGAERQATFTGMLVGEEKRAALALADLSVTTSYLESFGMAIVEALACRTPVVITDRVNICREVEAAGAGVVVPCDPERIAQALVEVLSLPDRGAEMGRCGRRLVEERFTWNLAAEEMLALYRRLLEPREEAAGR